MSMGYVCQAKDDDKFHGCRPWRRCKDRKEMINETLTIISDPDGAVCGICANVYRVSGTLAVQLH